jgi:Protein of unknown function (DUF1800)
VRTKIGVVIALLFALTTVTAEAAVTVTVDPRNPVTVVAGVVQQFSAAVAGTTNTAVTWSLSPPAGVSASAIGTIDARGKYTAPAAPLPNFASLTVMATSLADTTARASNTITVRNPTPVLSSVSPSPVPLGAFTLTVNGSGFVSGARVLWNGTPLATTFVSSARLTATGSAAQLGSVNVTVANPGPGAVSTALALNVTSRVTVSITPIGVSVTPGRTVQFQATVTGSANTAVAWAVVGSPGAGVIDANGLYTAPAVPPPSGLASVSAVAAADGVTRATTTVALPDPLAITYGRFLEQSTFGATPALLTHVRQVGIPAFFNEQLATPPSPWPDLATATRASAVDAFFGNAFAGADQLRQRVIFALSEIVVEAMNKNTNGNEIVPWLQVLSRNAFGNYRTLLREITLDASMGKYLDLVNSGVGAGAPNENYPRELMQLFSIGLAMLNLDGSVQTDAQNVPIPTYTQTDVQQLARALTGWTYNSATGTTGSGGNWSYYPGPMIPVPGKHIATAKTLLGRTIPANQAIQQDLDSALDIIFNHPNVGPFVATRLIRALVTSNPSPAYIARVAQAFNGGGSTPRGDMPAVLAAILFDPEARVDTPPPTFGRLRTPMQHTIAIARALGLDPGPASQFAWLFYGMNEGLLDAPSVFGHYSPLFHIPRSPLFGPEFQIYSVSDAVDRANFFYGLIGSPWPINPVLTPLVSLAADPAALVAAIDATLLYGRMLPSTRAAILGSLPTMYDNNQRVLHALYLTFTSGEYLVQH